MDAVKQTVAGWLAAWKHTCKGARTLHDRDRILFLKHTTDITLTRAKIVITIVLIFQISNVLTNIFFAAHPGYQVLAWTGIGAMSIVCVVFGVLMYMLRKNMFASCQRISNRINHGFWTLLMLTSHIFIALNFFETQSLENFIMLSLVFAAFPIMTIQQIASYISVSFSLSLGLALLANLPASAILQMVGMALLTVYLAERRYSRALIDFIESRELFATKKQLEYLAETDPLTGILNRRGMELRLDSIRRAQRRVGESISLFMIDIDNFKRYNDQYHHQAGDKCLLRISEELRRCARRETDIVARVGGEEFVIVALNLSKTELLQFSKHILESIRKLHITFENAYVTISIGVACNECESPRVDEAFLQKLLEQADEALFSAKKAGRNCISMAGEIYR